MVEPSATKRPVHRALAASCLGLAALSGCGLVPKSKMDECHRVSQTLRAENNRLKDVTLDLRAQNQDLSQRAVDDARRISVQDEAVGRLERSVAAYQGEREKLAAAFEAVKRQVRTAASPQASAPAKPRAGRLEAFAGVHPGWSFDPEALTLSAPPDRLFEPGTDRLKPEAAEALAALAAELAVDAPAGLSMEVSGPPDAPPVVRAGFDARPDGGGGEDKATGRFLSAARAVRVRDRLAAGAGLDPSAARLTPTPAGGGLSPADRRLVIRLKALPTPAALDAAPGRLP